MQFINWSGALIGPGSEWFWSMLQFVIVAGTLIGLYRQLRLQSSQGPSTSSPPSTRSGTPSCTTIDRYEVGDCIQP